ncbi:NosD domain-containing protein [Methanoculleus sp. UBA303]|uniref:NosD domain-containing protein n=1 Tax=Methanoculleus sp. UBA303 TaxID=1915497 RepID=UPI0025DF6884|nr:NosD domain-containing protein [Methanoculleus sp. UBA303]MDD2473560.1 NosD domain-containing protein [Methanoculleus sp.]
MRNNNVTVWTMGLTMSSSGSVIDGNTFTSPDPLEGIGIEFASAVETLIVNNTFADYKLGFFYSGGSAGNNCIYLNSFIDNWDIEQNGADRYNSTEPVPYTYNGQTYSSPLGNYWSTYDGWYAEDANGNGIGDTPYGCDGYPLMGPWNNGEITYLGGE